MMVHNPKLESAYHDLAKQVVKTISKYFPEYIPDYLSSKYEHQFTKIKLVNSNNNTMADLLFQNLILEKRIEIESLEEFGKLFRIIKQDKDLAKYVQHRVSLWGTTLFSNEFDYVYRSLSRIAKWNYEKKAFDQLVQEEYSTFES